MSQLTLSLIELKESSELLQQGKQKAQRYHNAIQSSMLMELALHAPSMD
jgi:hypothetical protein